MFAVTKTQNIPFNPITRGEAESKTALFLSVDGTDPAAVQSHLRHDSPPLTRQRERRRWLPHQQIDIDKRLHSSSSAPIFDTAADSHQQQFLSVPPAEKSLRSSESSTTKIERSNLLKRETRALTHQRQHTAIECTSLMIPMIDDEATIIGNGAVANMRPAASVSVSLPPTREESGSIEQKTKARSMPLDSKSIIICNIHAVEANSAVCSETSSSFDYGGDQSSSLSLGNLTATDSAARQHMHISSGGDVIYYV